MKHAVKIAYELTWDEAEEILQNLLDNCTVELHPCSGDSRFVEATSSEQELDPNEVDARMTQYFNTPCCCWGTAEGIIVVTEQEEKTNE